jgi:hypothetical protein
LASYGERNPDRSIRGATRHELLEALSSCSRVTGLQRRGTCLAYGADVD